MAKASNIAEEQAYNQGYCAGFLDGLAAGRKRKVTLPDIRQQPIESLGLPTRVINALHAYGCQRVEDVANLSKSDIWHMRGVGRTGANQIARPSTAIKSSAPPGMILRCDPLPP